MWWRRRRRIHLEWNINEREFLDSLRADYGFYREHYLLTDKPWYRNFRKPKREQFERSIGQEDLMHILLKQCDSAEGRVDSSFIKLQWCSLVGFGLVIIGAIVALFANKGAVQFVVGGGFIALGTVISTYIGTTLWPQHKETQRYAESSAERLLRLNEQIPKGLGSSRDKNDVIEEI